jgi:6-pyruvoyl-tetrahydropterin synthase
VIDFGELHFIEDWIDEYLDHGTVLCQDDPRKKDLEALNEEGLLKVTWVESASCEGIAKFLFNTFNPLVSERTSGRVKLQAIHLEEDSKNSATYQPTNGE